MNEAEVGLLRHIFGSSGLKAKHAFNLNPPSENLGHNTAHHLSSSSSKERQIRGTQSMASPILRLNFVTIPDAGVHELFQSRLRYVPPAAPSKLVNRSLLLRKKIAQI